MRASDPQSPDAVTVLIPSYRPDHRFVRTLESIRDQTHRAVWVNASIDPAHGHTMPQLPQFPNLTVIHRTTRLGWVGNTNALLATVRTPLFLMLSHDDTLTPDYLEKCVAALSPEPDAVVAHGSVRHHGLRQDAQTSASICGTRIERIKTFFRRGPHLAELAWRGVSRSWQLERGLRLRAKRSDGHLSNTLWALESVCHGASIDVPGIFYDRFVEADGLSRAFHQRSVEGPLLSAIRAARQDRGARRLARIPRR